MKIFMGVLLLLLIFSSAGTAEEKMKCNLQNKRFCGVWDPVADPELPGGKLTIGGRRLERENGDYAECDILDEENGAAGALSVLKCIYFYKDFDDQIQQMREFYLFRSPKVPRFADTPDQEILIWRTDTLTCLFSGAFYSEHSEKPRGYYKESEYFMEAFRCSSNGNTTWTRPD